jgi:hypothetical protein
VLKFAKSHYETKFWLCKVERQFSYQVHGSTCAAKEHMQLVVRKTMTDAATLFLKIKEDPEK